MHVQPSTLVGPGGPERMCERPFSTTLGVGGQFACVSGDSIAVLDTGATANLACFKWLANRKSRLRKMGIPEVTAFPAMARFFLEMDESDQRDFRRILKLVLQGAEAPSQCLPWRQISRDIA